MKKLWRSLAYNYREGGLGEVIRKIVFRFREWFRSETSWLVYRADPGNRRSEPSLPLIRREPGFDSLYQNGYFKARAFPETTRARLAAGERCHGFLLAGELVNVAWTMRDHLVLEPGLSIDEEGCVGIFDCYTVPTHRSKRIYVDTLIRLLALAREEGAVRALIAVDPGNRPSIKGIERAGFVPLFRLTRRRRLGRQSLERSDFEPQCSQPRPE